MHGTVAVDPLASRRSGVADFVVVALGERAMQIAEARSGRAAEGRWIPREDAVCTLWWRNYFDGLVEFERRQWALLRMEHRMQTTPCLRPTHTGRSNVTRADAFVGCPVVYAPTKYSPWFSAVIDSEPYQLGDGRWVVLLRDIESDYGDLTKERGEKVNCKIAAPLDCMTVIG